jgi:hypothetical protein
METHLIFDVYGVLPEWVNSNPDSIYADSRYRIYVGGDLITERNWVWGNDIFLRESIWINSNITDHCLKLEPIIKNPWQAKFTIKNFSVNNVIVEFDGEQLEISFKI